MATHHPCKSKSLAPILLILLAVGQYCTGCQPKQEQTNSNSSDDADNFRVSHIRVGQSVIDLAISYGQTSVSDAAISKWVDTAAHSLSNYFGHFPVRELHITVWTGGPGRIGNGVTTKEGIHVNIGRDTQQSDLEQDWVLTHEMFHVAFPDLDEKYTWLEEGLASYLEPLARARIGIITSEKVWQDLVEGLPQANPAAGDKGLDNTHTWERTYWGGSLFCLLADLQIREQTHNQRSLDTAMRAILEQGGNHLQHWTLQKVLDVGDRATGTHVLHKLHAEMGSTPVTVDLNALWVRLGVQYRNGHVTFDGNAPLATIRESMTR